MSSMGGMSMMQAPTYHMTRSIDGGERETVMTTRLPSNMISNMPFTQRLLNKLFLASPF